jgi:acyl dehydratase
VTQDLGRLSRGLYYEDLPLGTRWRSAGRTLLEADLSAYVNLTWFTEELFTNRHDVAENAIGGRPVPAAMVYAMAEGLIMPSLEGTGMAFLHTDLDVKRATLVGDTIYVNCEVVEARPTSKADRGIVRTRNAVTNAGGDTLIVYNPLRMVKRRAVPR